MQSRYYDPAVGRFINADESDYLGTDNSLIGYNLFAYCDNNPVMNIDPSGTFSWKKLSAIVAVTAIIVVSVVATVATFGAASVAGTIAITSAITIAAKATEVAVLQGKKSTQDGDDASNVIDDYDYDKDKRGAQRWQDNMKSMMPSGRRSNHFSVIHQRKLEDRKRIIANS